MRVSHTFQALKTPELQLVIKNMLSTSTLVFKDFDMMLLFCLLFSPLSPLCTRCVGFQMGMDIVQ